MNTIPPVEVQLVAKGVSDVMGAFRTIAQATERLDNLGMASANRVGKARVQSEAQAAKEVTKIKMAELTAQTKNNAIAARLAENASKDVARVQIEQMRITTRASDQEARTRERSREKLARATARFAQQEVRDEENSNKQRARLMQGTLNGIGSGAARGARFAGGVAMGAIQATGLGGGLDFANMVASENRNRGMAADIANSGDNPKMEKFSGKQVMANARATTIKYGMENESEVLSGMAGFTSQTGDLKTAMQLTDQMGLIARATGSRFEDIANAMGGVKASFKDLGAEELVAIMNTFAAQGKLGAVELRDSAQQMGKIAAAAAKMDGSPAKNLATIGAIMQISRSQGGATSASQAANSVNRLQDDMKKKSGTFKKLGVETGDGKGGMRDTFDVLRDVVVKSKGDMKKMSEFGVGIMGDRALAGFGNTFRQAETKKPGSGEAAVTAAFDEILKASMGEAEKKKAAADRMAENDVKVNQALAQMREVVATELVPSLMELVPLFVEMTPYIKAAVHQFGNLVKTMLNNPIEGALAAIAITAAASIGGAAGTMAGALVAGALMIQAKIDEMLGNDTAKQNAAALVGTGAGLTADQKLSLERAQKGYSTHTEKGKDGKDIQVKDNVTKADIDYAREYAAKLKTANNEALEIADHPNALAKAAYMVKETNFMLGGGPDVVNAKGEHSRESPESARLGTALTQDHENRKYLEKLNASIDIQSKALAANTAALAASGSAPTPGAPNRNGPMTGAPRGGTH